MRFDIWQKSDFGVDLWEITYFLFIFKFMKKQTLPLRDFFRDYNRSKLRGLALSGVFAALLSVSFVMVIQGVDTRGLMASVANVANPESYDADIFLQDTNGGLDVMMGRQADAVDALTFTILSDPERLTTLETDDNQAQIMSVAPGVYSVTVRLSHETLYPGTRVLTLRTSLDPKVSVNLSDTVFESNGMKYNLTNKGR